MNILLCRPNHFQIEYVINPWMKVGEVDPGKAMSQWEALVNLYKDLHVTVSIIDQEVGLPDMVFAADQGISLGNQWLLANFRYSQRQGESTIYAKYLEDLGKEVCRLPEGLYFEGGGEAVWYGDTLLLGNGFRSSVQATDFIGNTFGKEVLSLDLIDEQFYHLDTCLFVLNRETIFYYPPAFTENSRKVLVGRVKNLIELSEQEVMSFAANSVVIEDNVIHQKGSETFAEAITKLGYHSRPVDVSEFLKAGGGIHCLTAFVNP